MKNINNILFWRCFVYASYTYKERTSAMDIRQLRYFIAIVEEKLFQPPLNDCICLNHL